jgi:hypothetical protein
MPPRKLADVFASLYDDHDSTQPANSSTSASYEVEVVEDTTPDWDREFFEGHPLPLAAGTGPRLPTNNPRGFPHIIAKRFCEDFDKVALTTLTLADGVATMLYRLEKERAMPGLLDKFFGRANTRMSNGRGTGDFQVNEFTVTAKVPSGFIMPLFIARTKAHVLVSAPALHRRTCLLIVMRRLVSEMATAGKGSCCLTSTQRGSGYRLGVRALIRLLARRGILSTSRNAVRSSRSISFFTADGPVQTRLRSLSTDEDI